MSLPLAFAALSAALRVFPSGPAIPQQLLRLSIVFGAAQDASIAGSVRIRDRSGSFATSPFADPPLWSADGKTLTLLLDPSRQKLGLRDHDDFGFVLPANRRVDLLLGDSVIKTWYVNSGSCPSLDPATWTVEPVRAGSRQTLVVRFVGPIDVLSTNFVAVAARDGLRVAGTARLGDWERKWSFVPRVPWAAGDKLAIHPRLEDPCGNEIGEPFEHRAGSGLGADRHTTFVPLEVARSVRS